jgi:hypothetical protein
MLAVRDDFAREFRFAFSTIESISIILPPKYLKGRPDHEPVFHISHNVIENTQQGLHLV